MCVYYCVSGYDTCMSCCWVGQCLAPAKQCMKSLVSTLVSPHSACSMRLMFIPPFPTSAQDEAPQPMPVVCAPLAGHSLSLSLSLCLSLSVSLSLSLSLSLYPVWRASAYAHGQRNGYVIVLDNLSSCISCEGEAQSLCKVSGPLESVWQDELCGGGSASLAPADGENGRRASHADEPPTPLASEGAKAGACNPAPGRGAVQLLAAFKPGCWQQMNNNASMSLSNSLCERFEHSRAQNMQFLASIREDNLG